MGELESLICCICIVWSASYASTKTLDGARGESHHPAFDGNWPTIRPRKTDYLFCIKLEKTDARRDLFRLKCKMR